jgi:hypothetical protein
VPGEDFLAPAYVGAPEYKITVRQLDPGDLQLPFERFLEIDGAAMKSPDRSERRMQNIARMERSEV